MPKEVCFNYEQDGRVLKCEKTDGGVCLTESIDGEVFSVFVSFSELMSILTIYRTPLSQSIILLGEKTIEQPA